MASLNMIGPFKLNAERVDEIINKGIPGNYAYGHLKENGRFVVEYVGRSDTDLNDRIKHGIGSYDISYMWISRMHISTSRIISWAI